MFLATTGNSEVWDTKNRVLFLGEWCKIYKQKKDWAHLDSETLGSLWSDREGLANAHYYCWDLYRQTLFVLTKELNAYHNIQESVEYYDILLGDWLQVYIYQLYDKYVCLTHVFKKYPGLDTVLLNEDQFIIHDTVHSYIWATSDDSFMLQQYSQVLTALGYEFPRKNLQNPLKQKTKYTEVYKASALRALFDSFQLAVSSLSSRPKILAENTIFFNSKNILDVVNICLKGWPDIILEPLRRSVSIDFKLDLNYRNRLLSNSTGDKFQSIINKLLLSNLPLLYVEGFKSYREHISKAQHKNVKVFYTACNLHSNSYYKFLVAEKRDKVKICCKQHGGGYGTVEYSRPEVYERSICDQFYTYGWSEKSCTNLKYLPSPHMEYSKNPPKYDNGVVLIPLTADVRYKRHFDNDVNSCEFINYLNKIAGFVESLEKKLDVVVRCHHTDFLWSVRERLEDSLLDKNRVRFDDHKKKLPWLMKRCRVLVVFQISTTYLEALSLNKPIIIILFPRFYKFRNSVHPLFDRLKDAGIIHQSNESASSHLNTIYDDVMGWWMSESVQSARNAFVEQHARSDKNWVKPWLAEMRRLLVE
jgi:putative transferase (TIGR04331 family)